MKPFPCTWAIHFQLGDVEWEQLDFFEQPKLQWIGPLIWPSNEDTVEGAIEEFKKSLSKRSITAKVTGTYKREEDVWQLIPLK